MSFLQVYYTSCESGLRGGKGFQVNAATDGIGPSILQQVERLGLYVPPVGAPSRPTREEIEHFPVSLLFQRVGEEAAVVAQAKYVGTDYSGRYGNFFAHSLVSTSPELDIGSQGLLPIEMWRSEVWATNESASNALAALDNPLRGDAVSPLLVEEFLNEGERLEHLPAFLTAVERALGTGRRIVIVEDSDAVAMWIAAASYVLPSHLALKLTFNTYVKNPYQTDFLVVGTTSDSDFGFAAHEIEHQYFVFDFPGGRFTPIPDPSPFALKVAAAYKAGGEPSGFRRFAEFMARGLPLEELDTAFASYAQTSGLTIPDPDAAAVIKWCAARLATFSPEQVELLAELMDDNSSRREMVEACTDLYLTIQHEEAHFTVRHLIETQYLAWLLRNVSLNAPDELLGEVAARLVVPSRLAPEVEQLRPHWHERLLGAASGNRLCILLLLGEKFGFLDRGGEPLRRAGEEMIGPALREPPVQSAVARLLPSPAARDIVHGIGAHLKARENIYEALVSISPLLNEKTFFRLLKEFAFAAPSHRIYFYMMGIKAEMLLAAHPSARVQAFESCLNSAGRFGEQPSDKYADAVFKAVWREATPTMDEALQLLNILHQRQLIAPRICRQLAKLVVFPGDQPPDRQQKELINRLSAKPFYGASDEIASLMDAYRIALGLRHGRDGAAEEVDEALSFLQQRATSLDEPWKAKITLMAASRLAHVKDVSTHCGLLSRACRECDRETWIENYGTELKTSFNRRAAGQSRTVARLFEIWLATEQETGKEPVNTLLSTVLPQALKNWKERELEAVDKGLEENQAALRRWISWREDFAQRRGALGRLKQWFHHS